MAKKDIGREPPSSNWVRKLEQSVGAHTDPIQKLAKHVWNTNDAATVYSMNQGTQAGTVHFAAPSNWRENFPYSIPKGIYHTEGSAAPFSRAVGDGKAIVLWLKPEALPSHLPYDDAKDRLRQRADELCTALAERTHISPLEARVYFPPQKFCDAVAGTDHDISAALILATTKENEAQLQTAYKRIKSERILAETTASIEAHTARPQPPAGAFDAMFNLHKQEGNAWLADDWMPVAEVTDHVHEEPVIYARDAKGNIMLDYTDERGIARKAGVEGKNLGIEDQHTHVLLIRVDGDLTARPALNGKKRAELQKEETFLDGLDHDKHMLTAFLSVLHTECKGAYSGSFQTHTPLGDFIALSVNGEDQQAQLEKAKQFIDEVRQSHRGEDAPWQEYLDERHVDHRPPAHKR